MNKTEQYLLDIPLVCSVALEGGLKKYGKYLPQLPDGTMKFIHEWNRALCGVMRQSKNKKYLGAMGRAVAMTNAPNLLANVVNKTAVPYRSFYYAARFTDAYRFVTRESEKNQLLNAHSVDLHTNIVDLGRGLSPFVPLLRQNLDAVNLVSFDFENVDDVYAQTCKEMQISGGELIKTPDDLYALDGKSRDIITSLGTFAYMPKDEQAESLADIYNSFKHFYIELDGDNSGVADKKLVEKMGASYHMGWKTGELETMFRRAQGEGWNKTTLVDILYNSEYSNIDEFWANHPRVMQAIRTVATEFFIQR